MGCSLVTIFEVLHHIILIFLRTSVKSVSRIHKTIRCAPRNDTTPSGVTMAAFMQLGSNMNVFAPNPAPEIPSNSVTAQMLEENGGVLTPTKAALLLTNRNSNRHHEIVNERHLELQEKDSPKQSNPDLNSDLPDASDAIIKTSTRKHQWVDERRGSLLERD